jgi:hypothetical protein
MESGRLAALLAALAGFAVSLLVLDPGQYPFDSAWQLWQARTGAFNNTSPVAMTALWSLLLGPGSNPASLLWLNLALFWAGLGLCVVAATQAFWLRLALLALLGLAPLTLVQMAHLLPDAHLAGLMTFAAGLSAWGVSSHRRGPLLAACAALVYAGCVRHNAPIVVLPFGGIAAQALFPLRTRSGHPRVSPGAGTRTWRIACGAAMLLLVVSVALGTGLDRLLARERATVWPSLALWDLAAISVASGTMLLPPFTRGPGLTVGELVTTEAFDPASNTFLYQKSHSGVRDGLGEPYSPDELQGLRRAWISAVAGHPGAYLRHRLNTFWLLAGPHRGRSQGVAYFEGRNTYHDNPPLPAPLAPGAQRRLYATAATLVPTWCFTALPYLGASLIALIVATLRRATGRVAIAVATSALVYALPLVLLAPGAELRYLTWPIVAGPLALVLAAASRVGSGRRHPSTIAGPAPET